MILFTQTNYFGGVNDVGLEEYSFNISDFIQMGRKFSNIQK